jgi:hypothetical protein
VPAGRGAYGLSSSKSNPNLKLVNEGHNSSVTNLRIINEWGLVVAAMDGTVSANLAPSTFPVKAIVGTDVNDNRSLSTIYVSVAHPRHLLHLHVLDQQVQRQ